METKYGLLNIILVSHINNEDTRDYTENFLWDLVSPASSSAELDSSSSVPVLFQCSNPLQLFSVTSLVLLLAKEPSSPQSSRFMRSYFI